MKQVKSSIKYRVEPKLVLKTKGTCRVLDNVTPRSYWLHHLHFCEGLWRSTIKLKESAARMENIPSSMVLHKHVDGIDTILATMSGPLVKNHLGKWLGVIRIGSYQAEYEEIIWEYELVSDLCSDIDPASNSIVYGSINEGRKYQEDIDYQEHEVVSDPFSNPRMLIWGVQRALRQLKSEIESSKDKLFFINHTSAGSTKDKWNLIQVDMNQSYPVTMRWGVPMPVVHQTLRGMHPASYNGISFWTGIKEMNHDGTIGKCCQ